MRLVCECCDRPILNDTVTEVLVLVAVPEVWRTSEEVAAMMTGKIKRVRVCNILRDLVRDGYLQRRRYQGRWEYEYVGTEKGRGAAAKAVAQTLRKAIA